MTNIIGNFHLDQESDKARFLPVRNCVTSSEVMDNIKGLHSLYLPTAQPNDSISFFQHTDAPHTSSLPPNPAARTQEDH